MDLNKKKGTAMQALEMESLNPLTAKKNDDRGARGSSSGTGSAGGPSDLSQRIDAGIILVRMHMQHNPKATFCIGLVLFIFVIKTMFFQHVGETLYVPPSLQQHYGDLQTNYDLKVAKIDHWCLRGGNDDCDCADPTDPVSRFDEDGWLAAHESNVEIAKSATNPGSPFSSLDVVFLGDGTTQAWTGQGLPNEPLLAGRAISSYFNKTFHRAEGGVVDGIALGIAGDSMANLLWRIQNGEMPSSLNPKVWWLLIGTNDLVRGECSEEAIILGILRLAEEIYTIRPGSVVVIQGLLPRTPYSDGSLTMDKRLSSHKTILAGPHHSSTRIKQFYKPDEYPLWPSIQLINQEVERFCEKHEHMVYFDAASLFLGSLGNEHYQSNQKFILKELMPDYAHLNYKGYEVLAKVIGKELVRIIYDDDEGNHKADSGGKITRT